MIFGGGVVVCILHLGNRNHPVVKLVEFITERLNLIPTVWMIPELSRAGLSSNIAVNRRPLAFETKLLVAQDITLVFEVIRDPKPLVRDAEETEPILLLNHEELVQHITQLRALIPFGPFSYELLGEFQQLGTAHRVRVNHSLDVHVILQLIHHGK